MDEYSLEDEAEHDLQEIGRYTTRTWSVGQAVRYLSALDDHFAALARRDAIDRAELILAVLHENMDLITRFRERLDSGGTGS